MDIIIGYYILISLILVSFTIYYLAGSSSLSSSSSSHSIPAGSVPVSSTCSKNSHCKNGACGRAEAGRDELVCCPSGNVTTYAFNDYCAGIATGKKCWSDAMCSSGYCKDNAGGLQIGTCTEKLPSGKVCDKGADCSNGACGRDQAGDENKICCPTSKTKTYGGYEYCGDMVDGNLCWSDDMCSSGYCKDNAGGLKKGKCTTKKSARGSCDKNLDCTNGACGRAQAGDENNICCPSGKNKTYGGYDYCTDMPDGNLCWSDGMCSSGYCKDNAGGLQKGKCTTKKSSNMVCDKNVDCSNGACGRAQASDSSNKICCPTGKIKTYGGFDYCGDMPDGNICWSDGMCSSGYCKGNGGGFMRGICTTKKPSKATCDKNIDCITNACGRLSAGSNSLVCCPSSKLNAYGGYDYCGDMSSGTACWSDAMCASRYCKDNMGGLKKGTCR